MVRFHPRPPTPLTPVNTRVERRSASQLLPPSTLEYHLLQGGSMNRYRLFSWIVIASLALAVPATAQTKGKTSRGSTTISAPGQAAPKGGATTGAQSATLIDLNSASKAD